jgi:hypothetical protein
MLSVAVQSVMSILEGQIRKHTTVSKLLFLQPLDLILCVAVQTREFAMSIVVSSRWTCLEEQRAWSSRRCTVVGTVLGLATAGVHVSCTCIDSMQHRSLSWIHPWNRVT